MMRMRFFVVAAAASLFSSSSFAAGPICPAGTNVGTCLNNAIAAIDQLEQRVARLEAEVAQGGGATGNAASGRGIGNMQGQGVTCKGGQVLDPRTDRCACQNNWVWDGSTCKPKNAP